MSKALLLALILAITGVGAGLLFFVLNQGKPSLITTENGNVSAIECKDLIKRVGIAYGTGANEMDDVIATFQFNESQLKQNRGSKCEWIEDVYGKTRTRTISYIGDLDEANAKIVTLKNSEDTDFEIVSESEGFYTGTTKRISQPAGIPMMNKGNYSRAVFVHGKCLLTHYDLRYEDSGGISDTVENVEKLFFEGDATAALTGLRMFTSDNTLSRFCGTIPTDKVVIPQ